MSIDIKKAIEAEIESVCKKPKSNLRVTIEENYDVICELVAVCRGRKISPYVKLAEFIKDSGGGEYSSVVVCNAFNAVKKKKYKGAVNE